MRWFLALSALLAALPVSAPADEPPRTPVLSEKQIADGWLRLFDGESTFGWAVEGDARVEKGAIILGGKGATRAMMTTPFADFDLEAELAGQGNFLARQGRSTSSVGLAGKGKIRLVLQSRTTSGADLDTTSQAKVARDGTLTQDVQIEHGEGLPQMGFTVPPGGTLTVTEVRVKPVGLKSIFNGKDLTGWKKFSADPKRAKTEFSVTPEGWLRLKNGPGDLQTEGLYDDFVLQVECKTNGARLNSGVFFRCIPGEYQNGYEAQIHNGFADKPKQYTVEEFDPKTHEPTGKKRVSSLAIDYGTGAIYRRVPARKQAAKDNEWFRTTDLNFRNFRIVTLPRP